MNFVKGKSDLPEAPEKWICTECDKTCRELLTAPHPFIDGETVYGCPHCRGAECLIGACQIGDCDQKPIRGTPGGHGYRYVWTCRAHHPNEHD